MLSGESKEKGENTAIGLISKKATLHVQHTFFVHFFVVVLHDYNVKLPETSWLVTRFMEEITYVFLSTFCSLLLIPFSPRWPVAFLIFSPPLQNCHVVLPKKMYPLFFISRFSSLSLSVFSLTSLVSLLLSLFLCLCLSFSIFQICGHGN